MLFEGDKVYMFIAVPLFAFSWLDDKNKFLAGDKAAVRIIVLGNFDSQGNASLEKSSFKPSLIINEKVGNSCYISGVVLETSGDTSNWRIIFTPILVGLFNLLVLDEPFKVLDSSLHFYVDPGQMHPSVSVVSWMGGVNEFEAGTKATLLILPKDAFGNNVSSTSKEPSSFNFIVSVCQANGSFINMPNVTNVGWNEAGYIVLEFIASIAGDLSLRMEGGNQTLNGSPLPFKVNPGALDISSCEAKLKYEVSAWQIFSKMEVFIHQHDQYRNLVPGLYAFDADIVEKETNLSIPVVDFHFEEVVPGIQLLSFTIQESGNFLLTISDMKHSISISNMPFAYSVFVGYCDGLSSVVNGSGLNGSIAGEIAVFSVYLNDNFQFPSPVEIEMLKVQIIRENDSYQIRPSILPTQIVNGSGSTEKLSNGSIDQLEIALAPSIDQTNTSSENSKVLASAFDVTYIPERSGTYNTLVLCGNIFLNGGYPFRMEVKAGDVNMSLSGVVKFSPKVPMLITHEVVVQLLDSISNPVLSQQSRLKLEITSINNSGFSSWMFVDNNDGSYSVRYLAMEVGTYKMCVSLDGRCFSPFQVHVYSSQYFPKAYDDIVSVWEDESIAFDALANDYYAGDQANLVEFSNPGFGSLLHFGQIFRYTPYKDYIGNDSFSYTISDVNGNLATAAVNISVLSIPPQFVSFPTQLLATEDLMSPRIGGFTGLGIRYSELKENISVTLSAKSGTVFLSSLLMQFWQPSMWSGLSVRNGNETVKDLILEGSIDVINFTLQSIQYLGNENFYGEDTIRISARNRNGKNDLDIPISVEPVNDPPFIQVPEYIVLNATGDESLIFNRERDKFNFSIGDPDMQKYPGGPSRFVVAFSMEVSDGLLLSSLPAELISVTEVKLKDSYLWQPVQTYVTISKHFMVQASGIRFQASINDCNTVMQQLFYHGQEHNTLLTLKVNDMGRYGCYPDYAEKFFVPLSAEANVTLIRKRPMSSLAAHTLGSAIIIEFIMVLSLGVVLLLFTCKCAILLVNERRHGDAKNSKLSRMQSSNTQTASRTKLLLHAHSFEASADQCIGSGQLKEAD
ncbi:protein GAMETE EXPRESSED 2-like isoform X2 [Mangifera indica]|uniref:protein GAMETE EXPRESSED 2-like isoform X2 n=1 Tax=Mangifera indica TaxID=29780 RepID=UPI001CF96CA6|nr:protein GAMETE EXPRESSED 2-like isoform X2 [Mangifera indica]